MPRDAINRSEATVTSFLAGVARRIQLLDSVRAVRAGSVAAAAGLAVSAAIGSRLSSVRLAIGLTAIVVGAAVMWRARGRWSPDAVATLVERRIPESQNVIFTARELLASSGAAVPWMHRRVVYRAATILETASVPAIVPVARDILWAGVASAVLVGVAFGLPQRLSHAARTAVTGVTNRAASGLAARLRVTATVTAPAYTGVAPRTVADPDSLDVIQGGRIGLALAGDDGWSVRFGNQALPSPPSGIEIIPEASGYFAIERHGDRRLVPVTVTPDRAPAVRVEAPARDLLMPAARGSVGVAVSASDDFGLEALELRYTKVSGSGEQFEFVEGTLPLSLVHESARAWKATGSFDLARLKLEPGDSLVFRAVARDRRPGAGGLATSDTFFIEIAGPGQIALPGFELPPDRERYALSQQMIVLKLQRLRAREASLSRAALADEVSTLAAEQRAVRANFIFLMGGHIEDEEEEAEQSSEIQEGRLENSARREINTAIRFMGQAEQAMVAVDTGAALPPAKSAVDALQRAFGHNRYFLRTLAVRSRIDPSRRLTGDLKEAAGWHRSLETAVGNAAIVRARSLLARVLNLVPAEGIPAATASSAVGALAEEALAVDPGSPDWRRISAGLTKLRETLTAERGPGAPDEVRRAMHDAVSPLVAMSRKGAVLVSDPDRTTDGLRSAWTDEARRR
jgi:hypothetical protein